jgi:hypothetical protein
LFSKKLFDEVKKHIARAASSSSNKTAVPKQLMLMSEEGVKE